MAETPRLAHLVVLLFLGSAFVTFVCLVTALIAALSKASKVAKYAAALAVLVVLGYSSILFGVAVATPNKTIQAGGWKYFCEADCHIAYSIDAVQYAATLGPETKFVQGKGELVVVRLKTWFDENSIAPFRGNGPLTPDARVVFLVDDDGHRYPPLPDSIPSLLHSRSTPLTESLRPGESYTTTFVFEVPSTVHHTRVLIADSDPVSRLLVDHENSPLHGKIYFSLGSPGATAASTTQ
jgi:hypothetical protein